MTIQKVQRRLQVAEKAILGVIAGGAAAIGIVEAVLLAMHVVNLATASSVQVVGMPLMDFPAEQVSAASASIESAQFESVGMTIAGLPGGIRALLVTAAILATLAPIGMCAVVAWLCVRVFLGRPFVRSVTWGIGAAAILLLIGCLGGMFFSGIANAEIVDLLALEDAGLPTLLAAADLAPVGWTFALVVISGAFEIGQRMQRETEGLV